MLNHFSTSWLFYFFHSVLDTSYVPKLKAELRKCLYNGQDKEVCIVLLGDRRSKDVFLKGITKLFGSLAVKVDKSFLMGSTKQHFQLINAKVAIVQHVLNSDPLDFKATKAFMGLTNLEYFDKTHDVLQPVHSQLAGVMDCDTDTSPPFAQVYRNLWLELRFKQFVEGAIDLDPIQLLAWIVMP